MRRWLLAAVLILTIVDCFGQMKRYDTDFFVSQRDFLVAVPLEVERGQFYIPLDFNGRSCRFKLDTGASQGVLYDDVQLPGVTTLGTIESEDAAGHVRQMKTVQLPPFRLGPLTFEQFLRYRWVRNQEYLFTLRLSQGVTTTLRAFWPLQYNQD